MTTAAVAHATQVCSTTMKTLHVEDSSPGLKSWRDQEIKKKSLESPHKSGLLIFQNFIQT